MNKKKASTMKHAHVLFPEINLLDSSNDIYKSQLPSLLDVYEGNLDAEYEDIFPK